MALVRLEPKAAARENVVGDEGCAESGQSPVGGVGVEPSAFGFGQGVDGGMAATDVVPEIGRDWAVEASSILSREPMTVAEPRKSKADRWGTQSASVLRARPGSGQ